MENGLFMGIVGAHLMRRATMPECHGECQLYYVSIFMTISTKRAQDCPPSTGEEIDAALPGDRGSDWVELGSRIQDVPSVSRVAPELGPGRMGQGRAGSQRGKTAKANAMIGRIDGPARPDCRRAVTIAKKIVHEFQDSLRAGIDKSE